MRRIFVVDPDGAFIEFLQITLEKYLVQGDMSAINALQEIKARPPDLIITELRIPDLNGIDLIESVLKDPKTRGVPVLVCSASTMETRRYRSHLHSLGVSVIEKPFELDLLCSVIDSMLGSSDSLESSLA